MNNEQQLDIQLEAILFSRGEPMTIKKLSAVLEKTEAEIEEAITILKQKLENRGLKIVTLNDKIMLGTDPSLSSVVLKINKEEIESELSKASLETLSIVFYKGPISKKEIEYIRGVNSSYILRNLSIRGLIEKTTDEKNSRSGVYKITFDLLNNLGLKKLEEMPEYSVMRTEIERLKVNQEEVTKNKEID